MNYYEALCEILTSSGIRFSCGEFEPGINYHDFSESVLAKARYEIVMLDGILLFDSNGDHIAAGSGDELPSNYELL